MTKLQPEEFEVFRWLQSYFESDKINEDDIPDVLHFSLMWNLFEAKVCEELNDYSPNRFIEKMESFIREFPRMNSLVNENPNTLCYFRERYTDEGKVNGKFYCLRINNHKWEQLVQSVLEGNETERVVLALLIIIYRLRCHFFHGIKPFSELKGQNINFKEANIFLSKILDFTRT